MSPQSPARLEPQSRELEEDGAPPSCLNVPCFLLASAFYFAQVPPYEGLTAGGRWGWEWETSEWGVRFTFALGSIAFVIAALLNFPEVLND